MRAFPLPRNGDLVSRKRNHLAQNILCSVPRAMLADCNTHKGDADTYAVVRIEVVQVRAAPWHDLPMLVLGQIHRLPESGMKWQLHRKDDFGW